MKQIPLAIGPEPARTFENFLPGANAAALAHLRALAPGAPPVYLWGPAGSGKTHLLHALVERAAAARPAGGLVLGRRRRRPGTATGAARLDRHRRRARARRRAAAGRVRAVRRRDDARRRRHRRRQRAAGRPRRARGPAHPPRLGPCVRARSRSAEAEVRAALRREADRRGTFLSDEVMDYLLTRFARDLKHLMAQLDRLDEFSLADQARDHGAAAEADARRGGRVSAAVNLALFDLDLTLLPIDSDHAWGEFMIRARLGRRGRVPRRQRRVLCRSTAPAALDIARLHRLRRRAAARSAARPSSPPRTSASCAR